MTQKHLTRFSSSLITANASQNHSEMPPHTRKDNYIKTWKPASVVKAVEKLEPLCFAGGSIKMDQLQQKTVKWLLKKKIRINVSNLTFGYISKIIKSRVSNGIYGHKFIAAGFTKAERQKQPKCLLMDGKNVVCVCIYIYIFNGMLFSL